jgi:hypothetical protein
MSDLVPHDEPAHEAHPVQITPRRMRPFPAAYEFQAPVDPLLSEWLRLRAIVDTLRHRVAGRDGAASHLLATKERLDG